MARLAARFALFMIVLTVVAEIFFRTVVPATSLPGSFQDPRDLIFRFDTTWVTSGVNTHGRFGLRPATWRVNNAGWNSLYDYHPRAERGRPAIALLGDSFIEGFPTNVDQHVDAYLKRQLGERADVYAFGRSAWYLAQYVALADYVDTRFAPDTFVILINYHDIYDSLRENGVKTSYAYQITETANGFEELRPPARYVFTRRSRMLRRSAIVRYVRENLGITWGQEDAVVEDVNLNPGGATSSAEETGDPRIQRAADYMLRRLVKEHPGRQFVLMVDCDRPAIYSGNTASDTRPEFQAIKRAAKGLPAIHIFDLRPVFERAYAANGRKFEGADGAHWNVYGNRIVARGLYDYLLSQGLVSSSE